MFEGPLNVQSQTLHETTKEVHMHVPIHTYIFPHTYRHDLLHAYILHISI